MRIFIFIMLLFYLVPMQQAKADKKTISHLTDELTHHIVIILKDMRQQVLRNDGYCHECSHDMQTRHLFQRAFDIDQHLTSFLKMHGQESVPTQVFQYKLYDTQDLVLLLNDIDEKLEKVLRANHISPNHSNIKYNEHKDARDNYAVMDRIENFLLSIGSPSVKLTLS